jgi:hypothetical protein
MGDSVVTANVYMALWALFYHEAACFSLPQQPSASVSIAY